MPNVVRNPYSNTAGNTPPSLGNGQIAVNQADGRLFYRSSGGTVTTFSSIASYATAANFPAAGLSSVLYVASDDSRAYQFVGGVYVEVGGGSVTIDASLLTQGTLDVARLPSSVVLTTDSRLSDSREWSASTVTQADAEAGTATTRVAWTVQRVWQAIAAWWAASAAKTKLDGIAAGATANSTDAQLRDRSTHTGTQAANTISGLAAVATSGSASDLGTGTLPFARLPVGASSTTVAVGNDSRLSDARTPTDGSVNDAKITSSGLSPSSLAWTAIAPWAANTSYARGDLVSSAGIAYRRISAGTSGSTFNAAAWAAATPSEFLASQITSGILPDARLSSNVPLLPGMMLRWSESSGSHIDVVPRLGLTATNVTVTSGQVLIVFFTPLVTLTVSQITMGAFGTQASGLTLARMGIYTYDESTATLVARTASDTTLFTSTRTLFTRSLDTTNGFPATYTLQAGARYGVGVICTGTTMPTLSGVGGLAEIAALSPRLASARTGQSDLGNLSSLTAGTSQYPWARLS